MPFKCVLLLEREAVFKLTLKNISDEVPARTKNFASGCYWKAVKSGATEQAAS